MPLRFPVAVATPVSLFGLPETDDATADSVPVSEFAMHGNGIPHVLTDTRTQCP